MLFDWQTLALQTANFAILVWLLHRFLYKPVLRMVDARRTEMQRGYDAAASAQQQAQVRLAEIEAERAGIATERDAALKAAAAQAEQAAQQRNARATADADALLAAARKTLAGEREQALVEARRVALQLGTDVARRLLEEIPPKLRAEAWMERVEQHLAALPQPQRDALVADAHEVGVVTPAPLPDATQADWRACLQRQFGDGLNLRFDADPRLIAGTELHFATAVLRFSWQSALATIHAELEADAGAA